MYLKTKTEVYTGEDVFRLTKGFVIGKLPMCKQNENLTYEFEYKYYINEITNPYKTGSKIFTEPAITQVTNLLSGSEPSSFSVSKKTLWRYYMGFKSEMLESINSLIDKLNEVIEDNGGTPMANVVLNDIGLYDDDDTLIG